MLTSGLEPFDTTPNGISMSACFQSRRAPPPDEPENRTWDTKVRGEILIHASKKFDKAGYEWIRATFPSIYLPEQFGFELGGVVGTANLYAVATASTSPWFTGPFGFCLDKAKRHNQPARHRSWHTSRRSAH
jgi:hypothetical protein